MANKRKASFSQYRGAKSFTVKHPDFGQVSVAAPDEDAAIVAAATFWNTQWTKLSFYGQCEVNAVKI